MSSPTTLNYPTIPTPSAPSITIDAIPSTSVPTSLVRDLASLKNSYETWNSRYSRVLSLVEYLITITAVSTVSGNITSVSGYDWGSTFSLILGATNFFLDSTRKFLSAKYTNSQTIYQKIAKFNDQLTDAILDKNIAAMESVRDAAQQYLESLT